MWICVKWARLSKTFQQGKFHRKYHIKNVHSELFGRLPSSISQNSNSTDILPANKSSNKQTNIHFFCCVFKKFLIFTIKKVVKINEMLMVL